MERREWGKEMTAETSNAREDGRPGIHRLRHSQWLDIVNSPEVREALRNYEYEDAVVTAIRMTEQKMAENFATAPPPAAARGDVRGLVAKWKRDALVNVLSQGERAVLRNCTSALRKALAAEGVQAGARGVVEVAELAVLAKKWERMALTSVLTEGERAMLRNRTHELTALTGERNG